MLLLLVQRYLIQIACYFSAHKHNTLTLYTYGVFLNPGAHVHEGFFFFFLSCICPQLCPRTFDLCLMFRFDQA